MTDEQTVYQPNLFELDTKTIEIEDVLLFALGEFHARGKVLANRELALDRLRGAFKRASEKFGTEEFSDEAIAKGLEKLGSKVVKVPSFVAKHPFRITVSFSVAENAKRFYNDVLTKESLV